MVTDSDWEGSKLKLKRGKTFLSYPFERKVEHEQRLIKTIKQWSESQVFFFFQVSDIYWNIKERYSWFKIQNIIENAYLHILRLHISLKRKRRQKRTWAVCPCVPLRPGVRRIAYHSIGLKNQNRASNVDSGFSLIHSTNQEESRL